MNCDILQNRKKKLKGRIATTIIKFGSALDMTISFLLTVNEPSTNHTIG